MFIVGCSQSEKTETESKAKSHVETETRKSSVTVSPFNCQQTQTKIICKLTLKRTKKDRDVIFTWQSPSGQDNRKRTIVLPAGHANIFDARLTESREKGTWKVSTKVNDQHYKANFNL